MVCSLVLASVALAAQGAPVPVPVAPPPTLEFEALTLEQGIQGATPQLSRSADGSIHLIWVADTEVEGEASLQYLRWTDGKWSTPYALEKGRGWFRNWADFPQFREGAEGAALVTWLAYAADGKSYGIMYRKRREAGAAWSMPEVLHQDREAVEHGFVSLVPLAEGRFFANWLQSEKEGPPTALMGAIVGSDGVMQEEQVLDALVCDCCGTDSVVLPSGRVLIAYRDRSEEEIRDIRVLKGMPGEPESWGDPTAVGQERWRTASCPVNGPALDADGSFVALAFFSGGGRTGTSVRLAFSRGGGQRWMPAKILAGGKQVLGRVDVAVMPDKGPVVVSWLEKTEEGAVWCARAIPRQGAMGPILRFAEVQGGRNDGFLQLVSHPEGVLTARHNPENDSIQLGLLKFAKRKPTK